MSYHTNTFSPAGQSNTSNQGGAEQSSTYTDSGATPGSGGELLREGSTFYDSSFADIASYQRRSVTEQIQRYHELYGGSDNTQQGGLAASKSLNYAKAPTIQQAVPLKVTAIPYTFTFTGQVGLFGAENFYVKIDLDIKNAYNLQDGVIIDDYIIADIEYTPSNTVNDYQPAVIRDDLDPPPTPNTQVNNDRGVCAGYVVDIVNDIPIIAYNCYMAANISDIIPTLDDPKLSVRLENIGTGNIYVDKWMETMVYKASEEMWGYDRIYLSPRDRFFVGFHARNTRHLPFNVKVIIGEEFIPAANVKERELVDTNTVFY